MVKYNIFAAGWAENQETVSVLSCHLSDVTLTSSEGSQLQDKAERIITVGFGWRINIMMTCPMQVKPCKHALRQLLPYKHAATLQSAFSIQLLNGKLPVKGFYWTARF